MAALGKTGIRKLAELCYHKAHYAASRIAELDGYEIASERPFFKEFVVRCPAPVKDINKHLLEEWGIIGGYDLGRDYAHLKNHMLVCVTEVISRQEIDALVDALGEAKELALSVSWKDLAEGG
jgi:glycine dehydrogenase subunit 1